MLTAAHAIRAAAAACQRHALAAGAMKLLGHANRLAGSILDIGPGIGNLLDQAIRQRHIVHVGGHGVTVGVRPVEELQQFGGLSRLVLNLVHQDKGSAGDRPG